MGRKTFDYSYTCPDIDKQIKYIKQSLYNNFIQLIETHASDCIGDSNALASEYADSCYSDIESEFETIRETNSDMRTEAERQIESLHEDVRSVEDENEQLKDHISKLENEIMKLNESIEH